MPLPTTKITKDDFTDSNWAEVIADADKHECQAYNHLFNVRASLASTMNDATNEAVFALLGAVTSFHPNYDSPSEPYGPMMTMGGQRTAVPDDLSEGQVEFLRDIVPLISDAELRARVADVVWLKKRKGNFTIAQVAVKSYLESAIVLEDFKHWVPCEERIERANQFAASLNNPALMEEVVSHIEGVLARCNGNDPLFLSARMMQLLLSHKRGNAIKYAQLAEKLARQAESVNEWDRARRYWQLESEWHSLAGEQEAETDSALIAAGTYEQEAEASITNHPQGYLVACHHLQQGIEALRRLGGNTERIEQLHRKLLNYQRKSLAALQPIASEPMDMGEIVHAAIESVRDKNLSTALFALANLGRPTNVTKIREQVTQSNNEFILQSLFPLQLLNATGQVIATQGDVHSSDPGEAEAALLNQMFQNANLCWSIQVEVLVEPARAQINIEHNVRIHDIMPIVINNPFVPRGRERIYAQGLHAGMTGDFLTAAHLLTPQLEHSLRYILAQQGIITSGIDAEGIQEQYDANRMLKQKTYYDILEKVFGEDLAFDLRGLLVERFGANLRNDVAHGLLNHNNFYVPAVCYLWWLTLRLCCYGWLAQNTDTTIVTDSEE